MAIVTMKRLRLLAMREDREALLDALQRLGCVEVSEPTLDGQEEESGVAELLSRLTPPDTQALSQAQTRRQEAERAMGILKHYGAKGRGFLTPRPQTSKEDLCSHQAAARQDQAVSEETWVLVEGAELSRALDRLGRCEDLLSDLEREQTELSQKLEELRVQGKNRTVQFKELMARKLVNQQLRLRLEQYKLP